MNNSVDNIHAWCRDYTYLRVRDTRPASLDSTCFEILSRTVSACCYPHRGPDKIMLATSYGNRDTKDITDNVNLP